MVVPRYILRAFLSSRHTPPSLHHGGKGHLLLGGLVKDQLAQALLSLPVHLEYGAHSGCKVVFTSNLMEPLLYLLAEIFLALELISLEGRTQCQGVKMKKCC